MEAEHHGAARESGPDGCCGQPLCEPRTAQLVVSLGGRAARVSEVEGVKKANVELVFEPPWTMDLMSNEAKLELNMTDSFNI